MQVVEMPWLVSITKSLKMSEITKKHRVYASSMVSIALQRSETEITLRQLKICRNLIQAESIGWVSAWSKWASLLDYWGAIWKKKAQQIKCKQRTYPPHLLFDLRKRETCLEFKMTKWQTGSIFNSVNFFKNRTTCFFSFFSVSILLYTDQLIFLPRLP